MTATSFHGLESARLIVRRFADADLAPFLAYRSDPAVAKYQEWDSFNEREAADFIDAQKTIEPFSPGIWFQFAIELKETGALVGDCALKIDAQDSRQAEIGFTLAPEHQGRGFASEAVARLLDHVFATLKLHRVVAVTDCENGAAVALLERLGFRREGHFIRNVWFKGRWGDEYLYAVLRDEWLGARST